MLCVTLKQTWVALVVVCNSTCIMIILLTKWKASFVLEVKEGNNFCILESRYQFTNSENHHLPLKHNFIKLNFQVQAVVNLTRNCILNILGSICMIYIPPSCWKSILESHHEITDYCHNLRFTCILLFVAICHSLNRMHFVPCLCYSHVIPDKDANALSRCREMLHSK